LLRPGQCLAMVLLWTEFAVKALKTLPDRYACDNFPKL